MTMYPIRSFGAPPLPQTKPAQNAAFVPDKSLPIESAIARASAKTGVNFDYLVTKADVESSLNPQARAKNSSAAGLYQFIEKTWLQMVRKYGDKYGLDDYAACIDENCHVADSNMRQKILSLRQDPETAAYMAAEYAQDNAGVLQEKVGKITDIGQTELYLAHFLGANGASKFLQALHDRPDSSAATLFPAESRSNRGVFFDSETGRPRTLRQVYDRFAARFGESDGSTSPDNDIGAALNAIEPGGDDNAPTNLLTAATTRRAATIARPAHGLARIQHVTETPVHLSATVVDALLAASPRPFGNSDEPRRIAQETTRQVGQAQLLLLAQATRAHDDPNRYNA